VVADAAHEQVAVRDILVPLIADHPAQLEQVFLGAFAGLDQEARNARALLGRWGAAA